MNNLNTSPELSKKIKLDFKDSKYATGRRKRSIARVWIKKGSGNIYVNGIKMDEYFKRPIHQIIVTRPLEISEIYLKTTGKIRNIYENHRKSPKSCRKPAEILQKVFTGERTHTNAEKPMGAAVSRNELNNDMFAPRASPGAPRSRLSGHSPEPPLSRICPKKPSRARAAPERPFRPHPAPKDLSGAQPGVKVMINYAMFDFPTPDPTRSKSND